MKNASTKFLTLGLIASLSLVGCQRKSDPIEDYPNLRNDVAPKNYKSIDQSYDGVFFDIQVENRDGYRQLEFVEGRDVSYRILARTMIPGAQFSLKATGLPKGATLTAINDGEFNYLLKWRPEIGTVMGTTSRKSFDIQIEFILSQNSTGAARDLFLKDNRNRINGFTLTVNLPDVQPVLKIKGLKPEYKYGEFVPVQIEVTDPTSTKERMPEIQKSFDRANVSEEAKSYDISAAFYEDKRTPEFQGHGRWVFYYTFDTTMVKRELLSGKTKYEGGATVFYAFNRATRIPSIRIPVSVKISDDQTQKPAATPLKGKAAAAPPTSAAVKE